jgi:RND family efflux transporter MFP subunit
MAQYPSREGARPVMIEKRTLNDAGLLLGLVAALAVAGCSPSGQESEAAETEGSAFVKVVNVEVETIAPRDFTTYIRLTGEIEAYSDVDVSAEETGVIEQFFADKGDYVRAGAPIAKIRDEVLRGMVNEAEAASKLAAERFERQRQLWEEEEVGSEIMFLEAKYQAELQAARLQTLQARLSRTIVRAPITGVYDDRFVDLGEMVAPGVPVAQLVEIDRLKVTGGVAERYAASVQPGDAARISLEVLGNEEYSGVIQFVGSTVDPRNRTFPIEIVMDNPGRVLKPQMVANVEIADNRLSDVFVVPQDAVVRTEDGYQIFVVSSSDGGLLAEARPVRLGPLYANLVVVEEGLAEGDQIIIRGQQLVEAGDHVRIVNAAELGAK